MTTVHENIPGDGSKCALGLRVLAQIAFILHVRLRKETKHQGLAGLKYATPNTHSRPNAAMNTQEPLKQEALDFLSFEHKQPPSQWPAGLFEKTAGAWQGEPLIRVAQENANERLVLE